MSLRVNRNTRRALRQVGVADTPSKDNRMIVESDLFTLLFDGDTPFIKHGTSTIPNAATEIAVAFAGDDFPDTDYQVLLTVERLDAAVANTVAWVKDGTRAVGGFTIESVAPADAAGCAVHWVAIRTVKAAEKLTLL